MQQNLTTRFFAHVKKTPTCWLWTASKLRKGYGQFHAIGEIQAHRVSYRLHFGRINKGMLILHKCDNPPCVNPRHLFEGTQKDNMRDAHKKGRGIKGEKMWKAKLNQRKVSKINFLFGKKTIEEISNLFNVSKSTIQHIKNGYTWKHVN